MQDTQEARRIENKKAALINSWKSYNPNNQMQSSNTKVQQGTNQKQSSNQ